MRAKSFRDLLVWQKAHQFVLRANGYSATFPKSELYGLTSQFRRAAVSIPANICEGFHRQGKPEKVRFMNIAQASLEECRYYLILAHDLKYGQSEELMTQIEEVSRVLDTYPRAIASDF